MDKQLLLSDAIKANAFEQLRRNLENAIDAEQIALASDYGDVLKQFIEDEVDRQLGLRVPTNAAREIIISQTTKRIAERQGRVLALQTRLDALLAIQERPGKLVDAVMAYRD